MSSEVSKKGKEGQPLGGEGKMPHRGQYPGELLTSKGVVLVTANYRLGPFGFVAHPELSAENPCSTNQLT